jgi:hypothetical protein
LKRNVDRDMNVAHRPPPQKGAGAMHEH